MADTFSFGLDNGDMTLGSLDKVDGAGGVDTMAATISSTGVYAPTLSNLEVLSATFSAAGTVSLENATGLTNVESANSTATTVFNNIGDTSIDMKVSGTAQDHTFTYSAEQWREQLILLILRLPA